MKNKGEIAKLNVTGARKLLLESGSLNMNSGDKVRIEFVAGDMRPAGVQKGQMTMVPSGKYVVSQIVNGWGTFNAFIVDASEIE